MWLEFLGNIGVMLAF